MILGAKVASPSFGSGMNEFKINYFFCQQVSNNSECFIKRRRTIFVKKVTMSSDLVLRLSTV
jgi:hypothetical protein